MSPDPTTCSHADRTLLLLGDELPAAEVDAAEAHLRTCGACQELRLDLEAVGAAYARAGDIGLDTVALESMVARARPAPRRTPRAGAWRRSAPLAIAAALAVFVTGVFTGIYLDRGNTAPDRATTPAPAPRGLASANPVHRIGAVGHLARSGLTPTVAGHLIGLLETEPNPNVRLGILDALRTAGDVAPDDRGRILGLLSTEPVPALRIEILELAISQRVTDLEPALQRAAADDEAASVRRYAAMALASIGRDR